MANLRSSRLQPASFLSLSALALILTLLNSVKPLHIDDTCYYYFANQIAQNPFDPYGFSLCWDQQPVPANGILAPPLLPYWWAVALHLFGDQPFWWKVWLCPFSF